MYNYLIIGLGINDSALSAGYSKSYARKINSYERWINVASRIMQLDVNECFNVRKEVKSIQMYCEHYKEEIEKSV